MSRENFFDFVEKLINDNIFDPKNKESLINIQDSFISYFHKEPSPAEIRTVSIKLEERSEKILKSGLPRPIYKSIDDPNVFITWHHKSYNDYSSILSPNESFIEILNWIDKTDGNEFLLACVAYFSAIECDQIFITDKSGDEGIDLIALNQKIPKIPIMFFAQAKTSVNHSISREIFLQELGKLRSLPQKSKYIEYLNAFDNSNNGYALSYVFMTNQEIHENTYKEANYSEAILLSKLQLAYIISLKFSMEQILKVGESIKNANNSTFFGADLKLNIATKFKYTCI